MKNAEKKSSILRKFAENIGHVIFNDNNIDNIDYSLLTLREFGKL